MCRVSILYGAMRVDGKGFITTVDKRVKSLVADAARAFLQVAASEIPEQTGQARGVFGPAAEFFGDEIPSSPRRPLADKNFDTGAEYQTFDYLVERGQYFFEWKHTLDYLELNDTTKVSYKRPQKATPWKGIEAGKREAQSIMEHGVEVLPQIRDYISYAKISGRNP